MTDTPEIRGTFTQIDMKAPALLGKLPPIAAAQQVMVGELARLVAPQIHTHPLPEEFEDVADYLERVAAVVDRFMAAVGLEVACNAPCALDRDAFVDLCANAVHDNAAPQIDRAAEAVREEHAEIERAVRYGRHVGRVIEDIYRHMGLPRE